MLIFILTKLTWQKLSRDPTNFYCHSFSINLFIFTAFRVIKQQFQTLWLQTSVSQAGHIVWNFKTLPSAYWHLLDKSWVWVWGWGIQSLFALWRLIDNWQYLILAIYWFWIHKTWFIQGCQYLCKTWHVCTWAVYPHTSDKVKIKDKDLKTKLSICIEL